MGRLVELRDYHFRRESWEEYRMWANDAMEILRDHFDVVGFWFDVGIQSEISGSNPMELPLGSANVTWMLRWDSMKDREAGWDALWRNEAWMEHWANHPDSDGYLHVSARFLEEATLTSS